MSVIATVKREGAELAKDLGSFFLVGLGLFLAAAILEAWYYGYAVAVIVILVVLAVATLLLRWLGQLEWRASVVIPPVALAVSVIPAAIFTVIVSNIFTDLLKSLFHLSGQ